MCGLLRPAMKKLFTQVWDLLRKPHTRVQDNALPSVWHPACSFDRRDTFCNAPERMVLCIMHMVDCVLEHIYWATCCKTAECRCLLLVHHIGLCETSAMFSLPSQAHGEFDFQCSHCGKT